MPKTTRADVLSDLARAYVLEPVHDDEITIAMMIATLTGNGMSNNEKTAARVLKKAVNDNELEPPVKRANEGGRTVLAWKIKV